MPPDSEFISGPSIREDEEGLFSRDFNGQLIRMDSPTEHDYSKSVTVQIDGVPVTVPLAAPLQDAAGNVVLDLEGRTTPRYTTIYDAVTKLYVKQPGDEAKIPIPTLCHQPHMTPVGVCRLCVVQIYGQKRGKRAAERKLLPACHHQVKEGMEVFTMNDPGKDGERVRGSVKILTEMLAAENLRPVASPELARELSPLDELGQMVNRCGAVPARLQIEALSTKPASAGRRRMDASSPVFLVNHDACILCERCIRACDNVVKHHVIGRTGKGFTAGIGFDLDDPMGDSSCVKCGECMVSCPTSAITFKPSAQVMPSTVRRFSDVVPAAELMRSPVFAGIPPKFLLWQRGLVIRRRFRSGQVLFRQGDPGNTAFLIMSGKLRLIITLQAPAKGFLRSLLPQPMKRVEMTRDDFIVGEMACLSGASRSATLRGLQRGEVWELRRNVLDRLMRLPSHRQKLEGVYRQRAMYQALNKAVLFKELDVAALNSITDYLRERIAFVRVSPGQTIFRQGDEADDVYLIRLGNVRVGVRQFAGENKVISRGPGSILGEIGLLGFSTADAALSLDEADARIRQAIEGAGENLEAAIPPGHRTATVSALDHLELARINRGDFLRLLKDYPAIRRRLVAQSLELLRSDRERTPLLSEYIDQGLYEGQSLLALNMDLCTRCDECTRACVQQHGTESHGVPVTRLLRDGLRFSNYMIATSCRSCVDAYCMIGCPVDSIHRGRHGQIVIEDHCIGCGLCANNCPYGNIFMEPNQKRHLEAADSKHAGRTRRVTPLKATTCDLCDAKGELPEPYPRCVAACPHEAAVRLTGEELFRRVSK